ncbi:MAG: WD40/YVTN/BNR-like repeat-containing protein [Nocardioidaceae bacterium]
MNATHRAARKAIAVVAAASAIATLTELSAATAGSPQADSLSPAPRAATAGAVAADGSALRPFSWLIRPTGTREQFRGLAAVGRRVAWVSGEKGSVLITTNGGDSWRNVSPPRADGLALRDIEARDSLHAVTLSIGSGRDSRIYSTSDGGKTWKERFRNSNPDAFYDCLAISRSGRGMALSDPVNKKKIPAGEDP